ncbi:SMI1/KNR4 family protein [Streptomyces prunicolor]|uniref:SMI1/KNR4 family protein n=1 Tax=Streptomyces prunicolor TaxID=67348 RepID=UPI00224D2C12|nr:SMI1/KNR4 family protein [Streptomyces prunicolor]MCX5241706.1 SMI1/KNR4 family protein [Streptomyces prunicolor]
MDDRDDRGDVDAVIASVPGAALPADLVAWWRLDGVAATVWIPLDFAPLEPAEALDVRDTLVRIAREKAAHSDDHAAAAEYLPGFLPIADDAGGDHLLADLRSGEPTFGAVFLWDHERPELGAPLWDSVSELLADTAEALTGSREPVRNDAHFDLASFTTPSAEHPPAPLPHPVDWTAVETWLGSRLPDDYKQLAVRYGPLDFGEYLWIHVPCVRKDRFDYGDWLRETHRAARIAARQLPEGERPAVHPHPGGLLAWGHSRGGDVLFWDTSVSEDPGRWTVVVQHSHPAPGSGLLSFHRYGLTLTGYLRHTVRAAGEQPFPPGPLLGPLPGSIARTAYLPTAEPWTPPAPTAPRLTEAERRIAMETGTGLDALRLLSPPPERPYLGDGTWEGLFAELGTRLPTEYVELMEVYGAGDWGEWLRFLTPLRTGERRFVTRVEQVLGAYRMHKDRHPHHYPLVPWPEPGGFLPFANSYDNDYLGWLTAGPDPDAWPLIVWPRHAEQGPALADGLIDTLLAWQRGALVTEGLAGLDEEDDPLEKAGFDAWDDSAYW